MSNPTLGLGQPVSGQASARGPLLLGLDTGSGADGHRPRRRAEDGGHCLTAVDTRHCDSFVPRVGSFKELHFTSLVEMQKEAFFTMFREREGRCVSGLFTQPQEAAQPACLKFRGISAAVL